MESTNLHNLLNCRIDRIERTLKSIDDHLERIERGLLINTCINIVYADKNYDKDIEDSVFLVKNKMDKITELIDERYRKHNKEVIK